jgi:SM-20-related protein
MSLEPTTPASRLLDLEAFERAPLAEAPFPYLVVPRFVRREVFPRVCADFPQIRRPGSFPATELRPGPACRGLLEALEGPEVREAFSRKFGLDLSGRPTMLTLRGQVRPGDGKIHADSRTKLISALIYLNEAWNSPGGRLRLLRSREDLDDYAAEVPPVEGALVAFRVGPASWHGHTSATGQRRAIQLNWVTEAQVVRRELARHRFSARLKRLLPLRTGY